MTILDLPRLLEIARNAVADAEQHLSTAGPSTVTAKGDRDMVSDVETRWILDPVDGTANFIRGMPLYAISLALVHQNSAVLGVISLPSLNGAIGPPRVSAHGATVSPSGPPLPVR